MGQILRNQKLEDTHKLPQKKILGNMFEEKLDHPASDEFYQSIQRKVLLETDSLLEQTLLKTQSQEPAYLRLLQSIQRTEPHTELIKKIPCNFGRFILEEDGRRQITNPDYWPNSVHGVVLAEFNEIKISGTGLMIGLNIVLTAGHLLYDRIGKTYAENVEFIPGINGRVQPFGSFKAIQFFVSPGYIKQGYGEDYGILILDKPVGKLTGYFGLSVLKPEDLMNKRINVIGYPSDKVKGKEGVHEMWGMEGSPVKVDKDYISYKIHISRGQSGSGVWYKEGNKYYVVGVNVHKNYKLSRATLLTNGRYRQIQEWIMKVK